MEKSCHIWIHVFETLSSPLVLNNDRKAVQMDTSDRAENCVHI